MKVQNIFAGLLLIIATQAINAVETTIVNYSPDPIKVLLVYKNNTREVKTAGKGLFNAKGQELPNNKQKNNTIFIPTTKANPITKIYLNYIGKKGLWYAPINYTKNIDVQYIVIQTGYGHVAGYHVDHPGDTDYIAVQNDPIQFVEIPEEV